MWGQGGSRPGPVQGEERAGCERPGLSELPEVGAEPGRAGGACAKLRSLMTRWGRALVAPSQWAAAGGCQGPASRRHHGGVAVRLLLRRPEGAAAGR